MEVIMLWWLKMIFIFLFIFSFNDLVKKGLYLKEYYEDEKLIKL